MTREMIAISGTGSVSPAGWGVRALMEALDAKKRLPVASLDRPDGTRPVAVRKVPAPVERRKDMRHPRMRRSSPVARFALAAGLEALGRDRAEAVREGSLRLGLIYCLMNGCVNYSNRFYGEVLENPVTASPILFPETVFNAPASHLSALLQSEGISYTLVGDSAQFLPALELATQWLQTDEADAVLVVGAEEVDWLSAEAFRLFSSEGVVSEGAGALLLDKSPVAVVGVEEIIDPVLYSADRSRAEAARLARESLEPPPGQAILVDGCQGARRLDRIENGVWSDWDGPRLSPGRVLGDALGASLALQSVAAVETLQREAIEREALVFRVGGNQQVSAARFKRFVPA
ncbi:MAG: beta-ketoacyl synthase N-terminal-like domain-containing protein [Verrucomicrobiota bacterium]